MQDLEGCLMLVDESPDVLEITATISLPQKRWLLRRYQAKRGNVKSKVRMLLQPEDACEK
jgi:hypothetical protein